MTADELEAEFRSRAIPYSGHLMLLRPEDAIALVRRAAELRIGILGVDGMFVRLGETISPIDHIVDFSTVQNQGCWTEAESFIDQRRELGLAFEITLGSHLDHAV